MNSQVVYRQPAMKAPSFQSSQPQNALVPYYKPRAVIPFPSISHEHDAMQFTVHHVQDVNDLTVEAGDKLKMKVLQNKDVPTEFRVQYDPQEEEHDVHVNYQGKPLVGTPFRLTPSPVEIEHQPEQQQFRLRNVRDRSKLSFGDTDLPFKMYDQPERHSYLVKHEPSDNQSYKVAISYNGKPVENGTFTLAPHPDRLKRAYEQQRMQQQMHEAQQQQMQQPMYAPQQLPYGAVPYGQGYMMYQPMPVQHQGGQVAMQPRMMQMPQQMMQMPPQMMQMPPQMMQMPPHMMTGNALPYRQRA